MKIKSLSFEEFMAAALYDPQGGYYTRSTGGEDYVTAGRISPAFGFAIGRLVSEFAASSGDGLCSIVDIGCGDGTLLSSVLGQLPKRVADRCSFWGIDTAAPLSGFNGPVRFQRDFDGIPSHLPLLVLSNELFDALPFARLVNRGGRLYELYVTEALEWEEQPARSEYADYFTSRGIELVDGQFADVSLQWERKYAEMCRLAEVALIVTFDYGFPEEKLFDNRVRRYGTAAAYWRHQVHRDLLARPGQQDLTAHINFTDLIRSGNAAGFTTLAFTRQAEFLLSLGITDHPLFAPAADVEVDSLEHAVSAIDERDAARRLVLPEGIGQDIRVLVQARGLRAGEWSFQRRVIPSISEGSGRGLKSRDPDSSLRSEPYIH